MYVKSKTLYPFLALHDSPFVCEKRILVHTGAAYCQYLDAILIAFFKIIYLFFSPHYYFLSYILPKNVKGCPLKSLMDMLIVFGWSPASFLLETF